MPEVGQQTLICPITKQTLVSPVRSNKCGHVYSKEAILLHIKNIKKKGRNLPSCPVAGCSHTVDLNDLERDVDIERQLKRKKIHLDKEDDVDDEEEEYTQL